MVRRLGEKTPTLGSGNVRTLGFYMVVFVLPITNSKAIECLGIRSGSTRLTPTRRLQQFHIVSCKPRSFNPPLPPFQIIFFSIFCFTEAWCIHNLLSSGGAAVGVK